MALRVRVALSLAGQTATHSVQPVQSSGATCSVIAAIRRIPRRGKGSAGKLAGAPARRLGCVDLGADAACGQTKTHLLHWMQSSASQTGISLAMSRFSNWVVPWARCRPTGKALTGSRSPLPASIDRGDALHEVGRLGGHRGAGRCGAVATGRASAPRASRPASGRPRRRFC